MQTYFFFTNLKINCKFLSCSFPLIVTYNLHRGREMKKKRRRSSAFLNINLIYE